ncbi:MAG: nucleotidyl transferase AbiEii/AbiGii toxin family protein [Micrococcales bacterium]|nr:nucleotidyl transferase AbiEii/AbiGii toxin family protein [Micrococcales bacterium]
MNGNTHMGKEQFGSGATSGPRRGRSTSGDQPSDLDRLLESAATLQTKVPEAVLVGGTAAAFHARHRLSVDHDHVIADLSRRFDAVLDALEREGQWITNRVTPGKIILGELGGIETGLRQLIRTRDLEIEQHSLPSGKILTVPTLEETLRIKAFLVVKRNQVRDYLDVAAMSDHMGITLAARILLQIDDYYTDPNKPNRPVATQLAAQLSNPQPRDSRTTNQLRSYKGVREPWTSWSTVVEVCQDIAAEMDEEG